MMNSVLKRELDQQLEHLPLGEQRQVLDFAKALATARLRGVPGKTLLQFAGSIQADDLKTISKAIEDGCEKVDGHEW